MKLILLLTLALSYLTEVNSMSIFGVGKTCVFSEVKVNVTKNGLPLKNIQVIRRWEWNKLKEDTTTTDENGVFTFPPVFESSVSRFLPMELVIAQGLYIIENGEEKKIWSNSKREPEENAEFEGRPFVLNCELTNEMKIYRDFGSIMRTLCTWED